jgi:glycosyltransferase involved in cell wall biosynthesis
VSSVLSQTHADFEVVVVDDGSTDGGGDLVRQMGDSRIRLISQDNAGVSAARNRGIDESLSDAVAFLDADDEWEPVFLQTVVGLHKRYPQAAICATAYRFCSEGSLWRPHFVECVEDTDGGILRDYFRAAMLGQAPIWTSATMVPRWVFGELGAFPVGVKTGEDRHMWSRIALRYPVAWSPVNGAVYHLSADNRACVVNPPARDVAEAEVIEVFLRSGNEPLSPRRSIMEYLVVRRLALALECHAAGRTTWARELLQKTQGTVQYRWERLLLRALLCLPPQMVRCIRRVRKAVFAH